MAKTNYTKVEEILETGLKKMSIDHLFKESERQKVNEGKEKETPENEAASPAKTYPKIISALKRDLRRLQYKNHQQFYSTLGMKKSELRKKIEKPESLTPAEWEALIQIKKKIDLYKAQLTAQLPEIELTQAIEQERVKHINKRFNVNEKWLPLH